MSPRSFVARAIAKLRPPPAHDIDRYALSAAETQRLAATMDGNLAKAFFAHQGRIVHKWVHYLDIYERHFAGYRDTTLHMLEIGVFKGGSLELWRNYFGPQATLFGIDIDPSCAVYATAPTQVRIGSQDDPAFLRAVAVEMGRLDIVLDDGSHVARHQAVSFETLFPLLAEGGLYVIEDLHTAYWPYFFEGGYRREGTAIEFVKQIVDDMHGWYHDQPTLTPAREWIGAVHIYDSIVVIEKKRNSPPRHVKIGAAQ